MKKVLLIITAFSLIGALHAQSPKKLADDNGYKNFKIGTSAKDYEYLRFDHASETGVDRYYFYEGGDRTHFGSRIYSMKLAFSSDRLCEVWMEYNPSSEAEYKTILASMEKEYGKSAEMIIKLGEDESKYWEHGEYTMTIKFYKVGEAGIVKVGLVNLSVVGDDEEE